MIIGNVNLYLKNQDMNNSNYKQTQKVINSNNKISNIDKKNSTPHLDKLMMKKITNLKQELRDINNSEDEFRNGMSVLKDKEKGLNEISDTGNKLKELAKQYNKDGLSEDDKREIEKQANELLDNLGKLMNKSIQEESSSVGDKAIKMTDSDGKTSFILSRGIDITLEFKKADDTKSVKKEDNKHFSNKVSTKALLENPSIIDECMLKPVENVVKEVKDSKSDIYHKFRRENDLATESIEKLFKVGGIDADQKEGMLKQQQKLYFEVSAMYYKFG